MEFFNINSNELINHKADEHIHGMCVCLHENKKNAAKFQVGKKSATIESKNSSMRISMITSTLWRTHSNIYGIHIYVDFIISVSHEWLMLA